MEEEGLTRESILKKATKVITQERVGVHGDPENSFGDIAALWNWYLSDVLSEPLEPWQVSVMMVLFKLARSKKTPEHYDNFVDAIGYVAIAAELVARRTAEEAKEVVDSHNVNFTIDMTHIDWNKVKDFLGDDWDDEDDTDGNYLPPDSTTPWPDQLPFWDTTGKNEARQQDWSDPDWPDSHLAG